MELGALVRDQLGDDKRAIPIFERVLEIDADNIDALQAVAALYDKTGNHQRLAYANEKLLEKTEDSDERRVLILQIAALYETHLGDPRRGLRVVPARLRREPRRRGAQGRRPGGRPPRPVRGADPDLRGARARGPRSRSSSWRPRSRSRSSARTSCGDPARAFVDPRRGAARRSGGAGAAAQPRAAGRGDRELARPARRLRARRPGPHRGRRAGRAPAAARRGARAEDERHLGRARRDAAQLRARARQRRRPRRRSCASRG